MIMFIDPGLSGTGVAVWRAEDFHGASLTGVFRPPVFHKSFSRKNLESYVELLIELIGQYGVIEVWCENASYHGAGSAKGQMVASKGDLVKLAQLIGAYKATSYLEGVSFNLVSVMEWKGQLPKKVVNDRILKVWPECACTNHDFDAVGIGLWKMGLINT